MARAYTDLASETQISTHEDAAVSKQHPESWLVVVSFFYLGLVNTFWLADIRFAGMSFAYVFALALGIGAMARRTGERVTAPYKITAAALGFWVLVSGVAAWNKPTLYATAGFISWLVVIPGLARWFRSASVRSAFMTGVGASGLVYSGAILWRFASTGGALDPSLRTILGANRNGVAAVLVVLVPFIASGRRWPWLRAAGSIYVLLAIAATGSRASIAGALLALTVVFFARSGKRAWLGVISVVVATGVVLFAFPSLQKTIGFTVERFSSLNENRPLPDQELRYLVLKKAIRLAKEHPAYGVGIGNFQQTRGLIAEEATYEVNARRVESYQAHGTFAEALAAFGFPGGAAYIVFALLPIWVGLRKKSRGVAKGATGAYVGLLIWSVFHSALGGNLLFLVMAMVLGAAASTERSPAADLS